MNVENIEIEKLEKLLDIYPSEVAVEVKQKRTNIYVTYRNKKPYFYRIILMGIRVLKSNLTIKEFLRTIEDAEALKGAK